jgi:hypothetical protein
MQQQTGMPFMQIIMQQPGIIMLVMQSQQAWIIFWHVASPLVQVMTQPMSVISQVVMPMVMLQQQHIMPFIMQQQLIIAPGIIMHRFCIMAADILSSQTQVTVMPMAVLAKVMRHLGIIAIWPATFIVLPVMFIGMVIMPMPPVMPVIELIVMPRSVEVIEVIACSV